MYYIIAITLYFTIFSIYFYFRLKKKGDLPNLKTKIGIIKLLYVLIYNFIQRICLFIGLTVIFFVYHKEINPYTAKTNLLNIAGKSIVFQEMSHVGRISYYEKVNEIIEKYKNEGYKIYYEGVDISEKSEKKFNSLLGIKLSKDTYEKFTSGIGGLESQDYGYLLGDENFIVNEEEFKRVDLSGEEMVKKYEEIEGNVKIREVKEIGKDVNIAFDSDGLDYLLKAGMSLNGKNPKLRNFFAKLAGIDSVFFNEVMINERNKNLANKVFNSDDDKILILYGSEHFKGFKKEIEKLYGRNIKNEVLNETLVY